MNCKRHLRAVMYLEDKHVHSVAYHPVSETSQYCFIKCKVMPSLPSLKKPDHDVWVCLAKVSGYVHSAECDCTIGTNESCNHIGALLHTLVAITGKKKDGTLACTSQKCLWNDPRKRKLSPKKSYELVFKKVKLNTDTDTDTVTSKVTDDTCKYANNGNSVQTSVNIYRFRNNLLQVNPKPGWLLNFVESDIQENTDFSPCLNINFMYHDSVNLQSEEVQTQMKQILGEMTIDNEQSKKIELLTRGQTDNPNWAKERSFRITSSNFGRILKMKSTTEPDSTLNSMLYSNFENKFTKWGKKHEPAARMKYKIMLQRQYKEVKVEQCGLIVSTEQPYLGASPDGRVSYLDGMKRVTGLLEIKCPSSDEWKNKTPLDCAKDKTFYCDKDDDICTLKKSHSYYHQVQGQLAVSGYQWCDFVVWTLKGISIERINFDSIWWQNAKSKLTNFYQYAVLPELFSERVKRGKKLKL